VIRGTSRGALSLLLTPLLLVGHFAPAVAADQYWHKELPHVTGSNASDYAAGWRKLAIDDSFNGSATSAIFAGWRIGSDYTYETCNSVSEGYCLDPTIDLVHGESILPVCLLDEDINCIEGLWVGTSDAELLPASNARNLAGFSFPGDSLKNVPAGSTVSIWSSSDHPHTGGSEYAVSAQINWYMFGSVASLRDLTIRVSATAERFMDGARVTTPYTDESGVPGGNPFKGRAANHNPGKNGCFYTQDQVCGFEQEFSPDTRLELSLRVSERVTGWLYGRMKDPLVSIQEIGNGQNRVRISAEPVSVPKLHAQWNVNQIPGVIDDTRGRGIFGDGNLMAGSTDTDAFLMVEKLRETLADKATGVKSYWSLASTAGPTGCLSGQERLIGIVTTNSMVFSGGVPEFRNGYLNYKVAGLHYLPNGSSQTLGTYDILMRSEVARCLYGFSKAPVSATVAVIGEMGNETVATTVVSESDGWLKLAAYGFTFSEKEIKVRITQPQIRTLSLYSGRTTALSTKQKAEIRAAVTRGAGNTKFICTGIRFVSQPTRDNIIVRARAKAACDYAKSLNPKLSTFFQTKTTQARSYNGRVLVVSK
jgi:hypothetical protein